MLVSNIETDRGDHMTEFLSFCDTCGSHVGGGDVNRRATEICHFCRFALKPPNPNAPEWPHARFDWSLLRRSSRWRRSVESRHTRFPTIAVTNIIPVSQ